MFMDLVEFPIESERLQWEARQVLRDFDKRPHLLLRIKLKGTYFHQRALEPFVLVGNVRSRFVTISDDGLSALAYFDKLVPEERKIKFGYGNEVFLKFPKPFEYENVQLLDLKRLPKNTRLIEDIIR